MTKRFVICERGYEDVDRDGLARRVSELTGFQVEFGPTNGMETQVYDAEEFRESIGSDLDWPFVEDVLSNEVESFYTA